MDILEKLYQMTAFGDLIAQPSIVFMLALAFGLLYLGIKKQYEPLLLVPIGFGLLIANFPGGGMSVIPAIDSDAPILHATVIELAKDYGIWFVAGSLPLKCASENKFTASCLLINDQGETVTEYQKIHLFDVQVADNTGSYLESRCTQAGNKLVVVDTPFGKLGLAVCYDIRFAGMFVAMSQVAQLDVLALPAAFTQKTGESHWHALLKARAIENQAYLVASNIVGQDGNGIQYQGDSSAIDFRGHRLATSQRDEIIHITLDKDSLDQFKFQKPFWKDKDDFKLI